MLASTPRRMPQHDACRAGRGPAFDELSRASACARCLFSCASLFSADRRLVPARCICCSLMVCRHTKTK